MHISPTDGSKEMTCSGRLSRIARVSPGARKKVMKWPTKAGQIMTWTVHTSALIFTYNLYVYMLKT